METFNKTRRLYKVVYEHIATHQQFTVYLHDHVTKRFTTFQVYTEIDSKHTQSS